MPAHPNPCGQLMRRHLDADELVYCLEGSHYIVMRDTPDALIVLEFFHPAMDPLRHLRTLT